MTNRKTIDKNTIIRKWDEYRSIDEWIDYIEWEKYDDCLQTFDEAIIEWAKFEICKKTYVPFWCYKWTGIFLTSCE